MTSDNSSGYSIGYARVSTLEQDEALQHDALTAAGCQRIFVDKASGKLEHRPALDAMLEQLRPGDSVTVWRLDRLGRSLRHLIDVVADLERRDVTFRSLTEALDTSTPGGSVANIRSRAGSGAEARRVRKYSIRRMSMRTNGSKPPRVSPRLSTERV